LEMEPNFSWDYLDNCFNFAELIPSEITSTNGLRFP
jgi:hypothetical protein